jgi:hypothetical protein
VGYFEALEHLPPQGAETWALTRTPEL